VVGVHVRRTDMEFHIWEYSNRKLAGEKFFSRAMNSFRNNSRVVFAVVSDDPGWARKATASVEDAAFVGALRQQTELPAEAVDLAILSW